LEAHLIVNAHLFTEVMVEDLKLLLVLPFKVGEKLVEYEMKRQLIHMNRIVQIATLQYDGIRLERFSRSLKVPLPNLLYPQTHVSRHGVAAVSFMRDVNLVEERLNDLLESVSCFFMTSPRIHFLLIGIRQSLHDIIQTLDEGEVHLESEWIGDTATLHKLLTNIEYTIETTCVTRLAAHERM
jgi:hypothetical protein